MLGLYAVTLFWSSALLFVVQPLVAKMLLPTLGGSPAVWNTCLVFFQAALLAGYAYAHLLCGRLRPRASVVAHTAALAAPLALLPVGVANASGPPSGEPTAWLLIALAAGVGAPFVAVAAGAPLLQRWFSHTSRRRAGDPYFLYAASNAGSLLGLLAYPLLVEPLSPLRAQEWAWSALYAVYAALVIACGVKMARTSRTNPAPPAQVFETVPAVVRGLPPTPEFAPAASRRPGRVPRSLRWIALAAVPSSLVLGATQHITTDIAPVPLLWVLPMSVYLLTFILAYSRVGPGCLFWANWLLPLGIAAIAAGSLLDLRDQAVMLVAVHLGGLFLAAMVCHGRLAASRPEPSRLTGYYLLISLGGVLGGAFNALAAPRLFDTMAEYPIALVLACLLRPRVAPESPVGWKARAVAFLTGAWPGDYLARWIVDLACMLAILLALAASSLLDGVRIGGHPLPMSILLVAPMSAWMLCLRRTRVFALGLVLVLVTAGMRSGRSLELLHRERSFFGQLTVARHQRSDAEGAVRNFLTLMHGTTIHGIQCEDSGLRSEPLGYYHREGPIGQVFAEVESDARSERVAVVGLGAGGLAAYASRPDQRFVFFEIDAAVTRIAQGGEWFTYLADCPGQVEIVPGDGRLSLSRRADAFGLIILDAFSSDAIPVHLLTREAIGVYLARLAPSGLLAFHISNRHVNMEPALAAAARELALAALLRRDDALTEAQRSAGKYESTWVILARRPKDFGGLTADPLWLAPRTPESFEAWTDDHASVLAVLESWRRWLGPRGGDK